MTNLSKHGNVFSIGVVLFAVNQPLFLVFKVMRCIERERERERDGILSVNL
jgi:hypothetical protein